jgi:O-antigen/teichoic acid export membrane protein
VVGDFAAGVLARFALIHFRIRPYRPRLGWDRTAAGWFWRYGRSVWMNSNLGYVLDNFDDFWVGTSLGKISYGWYSKAYEFSRYPRRVVANPILSVFFPTFAFLQGDRTRLSRAFFRAASLIVRLGGLLALLAAIAAPEVFRLFLPEAWQPMRPAFQLMIVYTFLDPLYLAVRRLLLATGRPGVITRAGWVQLAFFIPAVILGARWWGIMGVALAADLMVLVGVVLLFRAARRVVDYSPAILWLKPAVAVAGITGLAIAAAQSLDGVPDPWVLAGKLILIPALYMGFLYAVEREQLLAGVRMIRGLLRPSPPADAGKPPEKSGYDAIE